MVLSSSTMVYDYIVFIVLIFASLAVAFYTKYAGPKEKTKADFVFAASSGVSMGAMLLSFARGTLGVRSFLGYPSELYYYGSSMWETLYGILLAYPIVSYVFVPVYYNLGITSVYQYLDLRFKSRSVRCLASGTYIIRNVLNLGVTVFTPCVALKTVIGLPYWASICGITAISIICTIVGGLKAVIIADVMQGLIMIGCSLAIIIQGSIDTGGIDYIVKTNYQHGRLRFFNFDLDPTIRVATVSALFGQLFMSLSIFGCQQNFVQRYCSMDSLKTVRKTLWTNIPVLTVLFSLSWIAGMVIFADYINCDPLSLGYISKIDEIVPFYVEDKFTHIPGLLGVFMASLFNGALSLSVSNLNSIATVSWEDFLSKIPCFRKYVDKQQLIVIKIMGILFGLLSMGIAFGVALLSGVIESSQLMTSATSGPLLGVFLLAMLFPGCNWKGAVSGMVIGHAITLWVTFGSLTVEKPKTPFLPLSIESCNNESFSAHIFPSYDLPSIMQGGIQWVNRTDDNIYIEEPSRSESMYTDRNFVTQLYSMTYMYYSLLGCGITVIIGLLFSYLTGTGKEDEYDEELIHPLARKISQLFPGKPRKYLKDTITHHRKKSKGSMQIRNQNDKSVRVNENGDFSNGKSKEQVINISTISGNCNIPNTLPLTDVFHSNILLHSVDRIETNTNKES